MSKEPSTASLCKICSMASAALHYGIDSCRACSSFFKRTVISGRSYTCRRGGRTCNLSRAAGQMCRGCRFQKCTAIGMVYDGPRKPVKNNVESRETSRREYTMLDRLEKEHALCIERRRTQELEVVKQHNLERIPHPSEEIYAINFACGTASANITFTELWTFFIAAFPSLKSLPEEHQRELFRICIPKFVMVTDLCRTKRIFGGFSRYNMAAVMMCTDMEHMEVWAGPTDDGPPPPEMIEMIRSYVNESKAAVLPVFERAAMSERESLAMLPLLLSESELPENLLQYHPLLESIRREILDDLHRYYTEDMGLDEYSTRLGNLLTMCNTCREGNQLFKEFFGMQVKVFDLYETETMLQDLILK